MAKLHLLNQDDQDEVQHDIFGLDIPLALISASYDTVKG